MNHPIYNESLLRHYADIWNKYRLIEDNQIPSLGTVNVANINTATNVVSSVSSMVPNKQVSYQSDFSKTANVVATGAAVVAAATVWFPPAAAIAGIVSVAASLLGKIFKESKAKKYRAERGEYEMLNSQLRYENEQLENQYVITWQAIEELKNKVEQLSGKTFSLNGIGGLGSKASRERDRLQSAKDEYQLLLSEQNVKTKLMSELLDEYNKLMKTLLSLNETKSTNDWIMWILGGSTAFIVAFLAYSNKSKIQKALSK